MLSDQDPERSNGQAPEEPIRRLSALRGIGRAGWRRIAGLEALRGARGRPSNGDDPADLTREEFTNPVIEISQPRDRPPRVVLTEKEATDLARQTQRSEREVFFHFIHHM